MDFEEQLDNYNEKLCYMEKYGLEITDIDKKFSYVTSHIDIKVLQNLYELQSKKLQKLKLDYGIHESPIQEKWSKNNDLIKKIKENIRQRDTPCYFITINPKDDNINLLHNKIKDLKFWKNIYKFCYSFEQRSSELGVYKGIHCHLCILNHDFKHNVLLNRIVIKFKDICSPPYRNTINIKRKSKEHIEETINEYLNGDKEPEKLDKVKNDLNFRKDNNLEEIYWFDYTTDKDNQTKERTRDGRQMNGGSREGAGRKKLYRDKDVNKELVISNENNVVEF